MRVRAADTEGPGGCGTRISQCVGLGDVHGHGWAGGPRTHTEHGSGQVRGKAERREIGPCGQNGGGAGS